MNQTLSETVSEFKKKHESLLMYVEELQNNLVKTVALVEYKDDDLPWTIGEDGIPIIPSSKEEILKFNYLSATNKTFNGDFEEFIENGEWTLEGIAFLVSLQKLKFWKRNPELLLGILRKDAEQILMKMLRGTK